MASAAFSSYLLELQVTATTGKEMHLPWPLALAMGKDLSVRQTPQPWGPVELWISSLALWHKLSRAWMSLAVCWLWWSPPASRLWTQNSSDPEQPGDEVASVVIRKGSLTAGWPLRREFWNLFSFTLCSLSLTHTRISTWWLRGRQQEHRVSNMWIDSHPPLPTPTTQASE
jgi:hypothetical protein